MRAQHRPPLADVCRPRRPEGWGAARYLATLCEHELAGRNLRRIARHRAAAGLPRGKAFATFEFAAVPTVRKAQLVSLGAGGPWIEQGSNVLCFGPSGTGKTHAASAIGHALIEDGRRVLFSRTTDLSRGSSLSTATCPCRRCCHASIASTA